MDALTQIYEGILEKSGERFTVQRLTEKHLPEILTLQQSVYEKLENKELLQRLTEEEFQYILAGNGLVIGAFVAEQLIATRALLIPPIDEEHLGIAVGLKEAELEKVIYQEISFVDHAYQGNRLQQLLAKLIMAELNKLDHDFRYVCCTVSPFNIPSLKDKFRQNMHIKALQQIYGNKLRFIFYKDLQTENNGWRKTKDVPLKDIAMHEKLLTNGWTGIQLLEENNEYYLRFAKK